MNSMLESRLQELGLWYYYDKDNILIIKIPVNVVSSVIKFRCPFCVSKYKNDYSRFKSAKPIMHKYFREDTDDIESLGIRTPLCSSSAYIEYGLPPFAFELVCMSRTISFK
tara:strand:- start:135 stop:467 length:333 start_codon:yes stop_codon:yes gene_type:complete